MNLVPLLVFYARRSPSAEWEYALWAGNHTWIASTPRPQRILKDTR